MSSAVKPTVAYEDSFEKLDIRVGRVTHAELETQTPKPTYRMTIDFGKFGTRVSYGRFTQHPLDEVVGRLVLGVLNFGPKAMGTVTSEVLVLGVQFPNAASGGATFVSPAMDAQVGSKLF